MLRCLQHSDLVVAATNGHGFSDETAAALARSGVPSMEPSSSTKTSPPTGWRNVNVTILAIVFDSFITRTATVILSFLNTIDECSRKRVHSISSIRQDKSLGLKPSGRRATKSGRGSIRGPRASESRELADKNVCAPKLGFTIDRFGRPVIRALLKRFQRNKTCRIERLLVRSADIFVCGFVGQAFLPDTPIVLSGAGTSVS